MANRLLLGSVIFLLAGQASAQPAEPVFVSQGPGWTALARLDFYTRDQGSRVIPLAWIRALKQPNGVPFLADGLTRFGYLPNPLNPDGLPVGFMASGPLGSRTLGMNFSACHTRQITVEGQPYRVDGGPAFADFQNFLTALDVAVGKVVEDPAAFQAFAAAVLGAGTDADDVAQLRQQVTAWYERYHALMDGALPKPPAQAWG